MSCLWECSKTFGLYELTRIHLWYFIPLLFIGRGLANIWVYEQCLKLQAYLGLVAAGTVIKRFTRWKWYCQSSTLELKTQTENRSAEKTFIRRVWKECSVQLLQQWNGYGWLRNNITDILLITDALWVTLWYYHAVCHLENKNNYKLIHLSLHFVAIDVSANM